MIKINPFPDCCAGILVSQFGGTTRALSGIEKPTEEKLNDIFSKLDGLLNSKGFVLLTLNNNQISFMEDILNKYKYECVARDVRSPAHSGSKVYIYIKYNKI